ncbi:MAG: T9SS type A sorting domain-containing protein [Ferruginibacter sp.]
METDSTELSANLLEFYAKKAEGNNVTLYWASNEPEKNITSYEIQKSHDAIEWKVIGSVQGNAPVSVSQGVLTYSFNDNLQVMGNSFVVYYRTRQMFANGIAAISNIKTVDFMYDFSFNSVNPNPFDKNLDIKFSTGSSRPLTISLIDASGRTVARKEYKVQPGIVQATLETEKSLRQGMYVLLMQQGKYKITHKVIKKSK